MCIICNCPHFSEAPDEFLRAFEDARQAMKRAEAAMLKVSAEAIRPEDSRRYDAIHKQMVHLRREWNKLEQKREHEPPAPPISSISQPS